MPVTGARRLPALQGRLVATLFFEPSTRTRSSFELAAKRLSADVSSFSPSSSSLSKGESLLDTARTYVAMGADMLVVRHRCTGVPRQLAEALERTGERTVILNAGDGLHSHPSQGLLDLYTLAHHFDASHPHPDALRGRRIVIVGDILHSRVARSTSCILTKLGAEVGVLGPGTLVPEHRPEGMRKFSEFDEAFSNRLRPRRQNAYLARSQSQSVEPRPDCNPHKSAHRLPNHHARFCQHPLPYECV